MWSVTVSRHIEADLEVVYEHFTSPSEEKRLDLHADHVRRYRELDRGPEHLEYDFTFQAFGMRFYGKGREDFERPVRSIVQVQEGVLRGSRVELLFEVEEGGTRVTQVTAFPERVLGIVKQLFGRLLEARVRAITAVHLDEHKRDIEGLTPGWDNTSGKARGFGLVDAVGLTRPVALPLILLPLLAGALLATGPLSMMALVWTLIGGGAALLAGNLSNDIWDFASGADHAASAMPDATMTGTGSLIDGRITARGAWLVVAALLVAAMGCGLALLPGRPWVSGFALAGLLVTLAYQGPGLRAAYRGYGLGELCIWAAFGPIPVVAACYVQSGRFELSALMVGAVVGLGASLVLYCHHFLHWRADRVAGKCSPVAVLGPRRAARIGLLVGFVYVVASAMILVYFGAAQWTIGVLALAAAILFWPMFRFARDDGASAWRLLESAFVAYMVCSVSLVLAL